MGCAQNAPSAYTVTLWPAAEAALHLGHLPTPDQAGIDRRCGIYKKQNEEASMYLNLRRYPKIGVSKEAIEQSVKNELLPELQKSLLLNHGLQQKFATYSAC